MISCRQGEAYWKEQSVIDNEDDLDFGGRVRVTTYEERVLQGA